MKGKRNEKINDIFICNKNKQKKQPSLGASLLKRQLYF